MLFLNHSLSKCVAICKYMSYAICLLNTILLSFVAKTTFGKIRKKTDLAAKTITSFRVLS